MITFKVFGLGAFGTDALGKGITGGQALFGEKLSEQIALQYPVTLYQFHLNDKITFEKRGNLTVIRFPVPFDFDSAKTLSNNIDYLKNIVQKHISFQEILYDHIVTIYWITPYLLNLWDLPNKLKWYHVFASTGLQQITTNPSKNQVDRVRIEKRIIKEVHWCWASSDFEKQHLIKDYNANKSKVKILGRGIDFWPSNSKLFNKNCDLLFLGRLDQRKGIYSIPKILMHLKLRVKINIIGGHREDCNALASHYKKHYPKIFLDHCIEIKPSIAHQEALIMIQSTRLLLIPSIYDNYPNVGLEALSLGVPIVGADVGGVRDMVESGKNGFLYKPNDFESAADFIRSILDNPKWRLPVLSHRLRSWEMVAKSFFDEIRLNE